MYFKQAKIVLYKNDKSLQKDLLFNAKSSDMATWFWHTRLTNSGWNDIESTRFDAGGKSFFVSRLQKKLFLIAKKEINEDCKGNEGWIQVSDAGLGCDNFPFKDTPGIYYSKKKTAALWSKGTNRPLKRQKNWAWTCGKGCTVRIILPVYRDNNFVRVEKKVGQGPSCARLR